MNTMHISVKALCQQNGKVLFLKDPKGMWELPGGRVEFGEEVTEALARELHEELGWLNVRTKEVIDIFGFVSSSGSEQNHYTVIVYECVTNSYKIFDNDEYTDHAWLGLAELANMKMRDGYIKAVEKFLRK
jgi:8-oxo-dGTP diphosphatase